MAKQQTGAGRSVGSKIILRAVFTLIDGKGAAGRIGRLGGPDLARGPEVADP